MRHFRITAVLLGMVALGASAFAANPARPGTVNYIEGARPISMAGNWVIRA